MKQTQKRVSWLMILVVLVCSMAFSVLQVAAAGKDPYGTEVPFTSHDDWSQGEEMDVIGMNDQPTHVAGSFPGNWLSYKGYDFGTRGADQFTLTYASKSGRSVEDGKLEIWIGGRDAASGGIKHGTAVLPVTGDWGIQETITVKLDTPITGNNKDIYFVMAGTPENEDGTGVSCVADFHTFQFTEVKKDTSTPKPGTGDETPQTKDPSSMALVFALAAVSVLGVAVFRKKTVK